MLLQQAAQLPLLQHQKSKQSAGRPQLQRRQRQVPATYSEGRPAVLPPQPSLPAPVPARQTQQARPVQMMMMERHQRQIHYRQLSLHLLKSQRQVHRQLLSFHLHHFQKQ